MEKWLEIRKSGDFKRMAGEYGIDPVIARILINREVRKEDIMTYLNGTKADLHDPHLLKEVDKAAKLIAAKIEGKARIRIIGDYDIDGVSATYILLSGLTHAGANVDAAIPDRMKDGYGINENLIHKAKEDGIDTIITCDNGIAAIDAIAYAKEQGMTVVVTDHHDIPYVMEQDQKQYLISQADAVINPKQPDCAYPYKQLCGAAVAYKFLQVLYETMHIPVQEADVFIENVGFATVGDVMDLTGENRILVKLGLKALQKTQNPGMHALILQNNLQEKELSAYHIGFVLGPCLNASGRLDTARRSLELLLEQDEKKAAVLATELIALNNSRKDMTIREVEHANQIIEEQHLLGDKVLVVYLPECHESLAGIIAGRIRETYHRPVFVLTKGEEGVKGSGRSIEAYSMFDELTGVADLLSKFGGHPMAAGLSLAFDEEEQPGDATEDTVEIGATSTTEVKSTNMSETGSADKIQGKIQDKIQELRTRLNAQATLTDGDLVETVRIDAAMPLSYISTSLIRQLKLLEPCGKGNTKPVFAERDIGVERANIIGKNQNVLKLQLISSNGCRMNGVFFGEVEVFLTYLKEKCGEAEVTAMLMGKSNHVRFSAVYEPTIDSYSGRDQLQVIIRKIR